MAYAAVIDNGKDGSCRDTSEQGALGCCDAAMFNPVTKSYRPTIQSLFLTRSSWQTSSRFRSTS